MSTLEEEDAKRPRRERENLVGERTRIINRMKGALARLGIRGFKPELRRALEKLVALGTPEGQPLPPNMLEEMRRDMTRLALVRDQIAAIEQTRLARLEQTGPLRFLVCRPETQRQRLVQVVHRRDRRAGGSCAPNWASAAHAGGGTLCSTTGVRSKPARRFSRSR